jgi:hypothetical protein
MENTIISRDGLLPVNGVSYTPIPAPRLVGLTQSVPAQEKRGLVLRDYCHANAGSQPPPRAVPPLRAALQDVTARANQSPLMLPPLGKSAGTPSWKPTGSEYLETAQVKARDETDALRKYYQDTAVDLPRVVPPGPAIPTNPSLPLPGSISAQRAPPVAMPGAAAARAQVPAASSSSSSSRKRKSEASSSPEEAIAAYKQNLDHIDLRGVAMDKDCTAVRALINRALERGIFKKGEFCNIIGCSHNALNRFLAQTGRDGGSGCDAY